ncbi:hypothetical protein Tco_0223153 [Tanacetum coccineum]
MSTQQDIYAAGFENRPPMLNKDNYVPWSFRLLRYAKSKPNGKLIYNSIMHGLYVRRMIPEPGDPDREVPVDYFIGLPGRHYAAVDSCEACSRKSGYVEVNELKAERLARAHDHLALMANSNNPYNYPVFHQDQLSQITHMQQPQPNSNFIPQPSFNTNYMQQPMLNPEDITDPTTVMNMSLVLMAKAFKLNYSTSTNNNQRISSNPRNKQIAQPSMNLGQDRQMQMVGGNKGNQFRRYAGQNIGNQNGYNAVHTVRNQVVQNAVQNPVIQNVGNQNGLIVVSRIANQNLNPNELVML